MQKIRRRFWGLTVVLFVTVLGASFLFSGCASWVEEEAARLEEQNAIRIPDGPQRAFAAEHIAGDGWELIVIDTLYRRGRIYPDSDTYKHSSAHMYYVKPSQRDAFMRDFEIYNATRVEKERLEKDESDKIAAEAKAKRNAGMTEEQIFKRDIREDQIKLQAILSEINPTNEFGATMGFAFANIIKEKYDDMSGDMRPRKVDRDDLRVLYSIFNTYVSIVASVGQVRNIRMDMNIIVTTTAWKDKMHNLWDYAQQGW